MKMTSSGFGVSDDMSFSENKIHMTNSPKSLIARMKAIAKDDQFAIDEFDNIIRMYIFDYPKDQYMEVFDRIVSSCPEAESMRADIETYYDEFKDIEDQLPNSPDWMDAIE